MDVAVPRCWNSDPAPPKAALDGSQSVEQSTSSALLVAAGNKRPRSRILERSTKTYIFREIQRIFYKTTSYILTTISPVSCRGGVFGCQAGGSPRAARKTALWRALWRYVLQIAGIRARALKAVVDATRGNRFQTRPG
ncbi:jg15093 [Pararge aegeria aegeria]|uniref:Jg15093 protein n=1 Tax=Pararge aegeria aegeria TaxID=348720 RepID=A0A8S4QR76_9NEOP|nr:jg15093 [Pararge aegeria aegeria]